MAEKLGVIFDMDGVLVKSYGPHLRSWQEMAQKNGLSMTEAQFASTFGKTTREIIRLMWPNKFDEAGVAQLDAAKEAAYRHILSTEFPEMPGAFELIGALNLAGFALAIGSSGPPENVELVHSKLSAGKLIGVAVNGMDVKHGKPEPDVFIAAAKKLGLKPKFCAVIEDAPVGIEAARRAGMTAIGLTGTVKRDALSNADLVVDSLKELTPAIITKLIEGDGEDD